MSRPIVQPQGITGGIGAGEYSFRTVVIVGDLSTAAESVRLLHHRLPRSTAGRRRRGDSSAGRRERAFMIIFGISSKQKAKPAGTFHCPVCEAKRTYAELRQTRRFTLFFIPVLPLGSSSTGRIICTTCGSEFSENMAG